MQQQAISKEMTIEEIFEKFPDKAPLLAGEMESRNLHCVGCSASSWETLEAGMLGHGFGKADIESMVQALNKIINEKVDTTTITITPSAAEKFKSLLKQQKKEGWALRLGDRPAGCSGFEYTLEFSQKPLETDQVFNSEGIEIHVNGKSAQRMVGARVDYVDGLSGSGFKISNPNVKSSCGCGKSQSY